MPGKNKRTEAPPRPDSGEEGRQAGLMPGAPGYRTRDGRSGYDPVDMRTEAAHVSGTLLQGLFSGNLRITHPLVLLLTGALGLALIAPALLALFELAQGNLFSWEAGIMLFIAGLVGFALLANFFKNLGRWR